MGRAPCCDKANVKKGPWSAEEDAELKAYIEEHGTGGNWIALPHKIGLKRCGKSCRLRWLNYLRPNIKHGGFTEEEDQIICSLYISIGSRWSIIAAQLPGRTDNDIKNYWNTKLKKRLLGKRKESSRSHRLHLKQALDEEGDGTNHDTHSQALSASALERMQLQMQLQGLCNVPFSFYNPPALWPKYHPLGDRVFQTQLTDASVATHETAIDSAQQVVFPMKPETPKSIGANMQRELDCSALGFQSPSSGGTLSMQACVAAGVQADLHSLLYCKSTSSVGDEEHQQLADLDCYKEIYGEKESTDWWTTTGFEDKLLMGPWDSASALHSDPMIQDYAPRYEDL
ncbi:unnamed protein product [Musa banksii]